jgi:hypothetical protein
VRVNRRDEAEERPWEASHATPEDRALGLELELIELESRRVRDTDPAALEAEARDVLSALAQAADQLVARPASTVRIRVPRDPAA